MYNTMKNIKYIILSLLMATSFVACDTVDFGDINVNKNGPSDPYTSGLLASAIMNYSNVTGRDYIIKPTLYVQWQSQVTYTDEMLYNESQSSWYRYYVTQLSNLQEVINYCSDPANEFDTALLDQGSIKNQIGVSTIMKAVIFKRVTDTWGDVPFTEALDPVNNIIQNYDDQEAIYKGIINMLKEGRDMLELKKKGPTGDIIYGGDVSRWRKLANSLIMQASLQLSKVYPNAGGYAANEFATAYNDGPILSLDDEAWYNFDEDSGYNSPWNANRPTDYFFSKEFTDALNGKKELNPTSNHTKDLRLSVYGTSTNDGVPYGYKNGSGGNSAQMSTENYWNNEATIPMMTASYTYLNVADAANMGWISASPEDALRIGIMLSYQTLANHKTIPGMTADDFNEYGIETYAVARIADIGTFGLKQIIAEEKWVSLFPSGFDAWAEWRRTEIPALVPATDAYNDGNIPRRYLYPGEEASLNAAGYSKGVSTLSPATDNNTSRMWWDQ